MVNSRLRGAADWWHSSERHFVDTLFNWARISLKFAQVNSAFYLNRMENEYQLRLMVKVLRCICEANEYM